MGKASFMFPLSIPSEITSVFGWRIHPIMGNQRFHSGTDLGAPQGTPVLAAVSGQVVTADFLGGYGLTVILQHEKGTQESLYAHLSEIFVKPGDKVEQGNVIGRVGSTGNSTGPHLHFEWRHLTSEGWVAVDAGAHLQYSLAQFIRALQLAQSTPQRGT
jgi:murein DD-endopeptidase MepM/ murein hydrolase activator NlpD